MSAPVLSWLLTAQGKPRKAFLNRQLSPCANPLSTVRHQVASAQLEHQIKDPHTQPSEPILFPKLRIYFADFPYLLCPIDQRLLTLEAWCSYGYDQGCECNFPSVFQGQPGAHQKPQKTRLFPHNATPPPSNEISGKEVVNKKRQRSLRPPICITKLIDVTNECPRPGYGLLALSPFK